MDLLISHQTLLDHPEEASVVLFESVYNTERGPDLLKAVTGVKEPTLNLFLTKSKILFSELLGISSLLKENASIWHKAYISMCKMTADFNQFIAGIEEGVEQPVSVVEAQASLAEQSKNLEELVNPYNRNIICIWKKTKIRAQL